MTSAKLESALLLFIRDELRVEEPELDRDTELVSTGLVDSVALVRLATYLERELGIAIADREMNVENFDSVSRMLDFIGPHFPR